MIEAVPEPRTPEVLGATIIRDTEILDTGVGQSPMTANHPGNGALDDDKKRTDRTY